MRRLPVLLLFVVVCACSSQSSTEPAATSGAPTAAAIKTMPQFEATRLLEHIKVLSSDEFEGRAPGSKGEELTVK